MAAASTASWNSAGSWRLTRPPPSSVARTPYGMSFQYMIRTRAIRQEPPAPESRRTQGASAPAREALAARLGAEGAGGAHAAAAHRGTGVVGAVAGRLSSG